MKIITESKEVITKAKIVIELETKDEIKAFQSILENAQFSITQRRMSVTSISKIEDTILSNLKNQLH